MERTGSREGFGNDKPLWKQRRGHLLQFPDHKATEKEKLTEKLRKNKRKRKGQKSGCDINPSPVYYSVGPARHSTPRNPTRRTHRRFSSRGRGRSEFVVEAPTLGRPR